MFVYLRYFSVISSIAIIIAAVLLGYSFRTIAAGDLKDIVERNNHALAQGFINTTWKNHWSDMAVIYTLPQSDWNKYREFVEFSKDVFRYFEDTPVAKVNIYSPTGVRMISTDQSDIVYGQKEKVQQDTALRNTFAAALRGTKSTEIIPDAAFRGSDGTLQKGALVRTLVPVVSDNYVPIVQGSDAALPANVQGVVEIFFNITPQWKQLYLFQMVGTGGIIFIFMVLILMLLYTSRKAEMIIARQHEANLELAAQASAAQAENQNKSLFLANISHELRTPLNAIIGFSEIMKTELMGSFENTRYQDYIRDIHSSGVHLLSLINDILDYSKAEAGKLECHFADVDATKIVQNSMRLVSPRAEAAEVKLVEDIPKEHIVMRTDAKKLKQVLLNLLSNAVKFTPAGGEVSVTVWLNKLENSMGILVKDTGIGIAPKDISRAMSPFGQVDNTLSRKHEGTGLGLPLTYKFVHLLGGTFDIQSKPGAGTSIRITLPLAPSDDIEKANQERLEEQKRQSEEATPPPPMPSVMPITPADPA